MQANRLDKILDRLAHAAIIIDDEDRWYGRGFHALASPLAGRVK
jgi:hypothetical protein